MKSLLSLLAGFFILSGNVNAGDAPPPPTVITGTSGSAEVSTESGIWKLSMPISKVSGYTQYEIGGTVVVDGVSTELDFPISQLKFPLNFYSLGLRAERKIGERHTFFIEASKDISSNRGKMEDSDYLPGGLIFIFSESDTEIDAKMLDVGLNFTVLQDSYYTYSILLGYRIEDFDYKVKNLNQYQLLPLQNQIEHTRIHGLVGTYDVTYHTPYISARLQVLSGEFLKIGFFLDYSPFIFVRDRDDHILRKILSKGKTYGNSYRVGIDLFRPLGNNSFAVFRAYRSHARADGTDTSFIYEGADFGKTWKIDHKNESSVSVFSLLVGVRF